MQKSIFLTPVSQARSRPLNGLMSWLSKHTFELGSYTIASSLLRIKIDINPDFIRLVANLGVFLGVVLTILGIIVKILELKKFWKGRKSRRRK